METRIRLFIIDDHEIVRAGLRRMLEGVPEIELAGEAADGLAALDAINQLYPDVLLVDVKLPGISGIEVVRRVKANQATEDIEAVMLTVYDDLDLATESLRAGALSYILKDSGKEQLVTAIKSAFRKESMLARGVTRRMAGAGTKQVPEKLSAALTPRERGVLMLVAQGLSNKDIARELYISEGTVKVHLKNIYKKLQVEDRTQALMVGIREGLIKP